jgi:tripartite-type tricarboxylate transporter receptor subunit TctC
MEGTRMGRSAIYLMLAAVLSLFAHFAAAQTPPGRGTIGYPAKTVRMLVGVAPGGGIDVIARFFSQKLTESLGQSVIVDNRPGAGGNIAADHVAKAAPDGYTLLMTSAVLAINVSLYSKLTYDAAKDFTAVGAVAITPNCIAVHPSLPAKSAREFIALAKAQPGALSYASAGSGTPMHLAMELFRSMAGIKLLHVPYNGSGPSTNAVVGGHVPVLSTSLPTALPHARAGKLRMVGVTSAERTQLAPEYPTIAEAAPLPGYEANVWFGLMAPVGTPAAVVNKLNAEIERLLQIRDVRERLTAIGFDPYWQAPNAFGEIVQSDIARWGKVVRESGARAD